MKTQPLPIEMESPVSRDEGASVAVESPEQFKSSHPPMSSSTGANIWFAGAFAGLSVNIMIFPLDTIKTRLQSPSFRHSYHGATILASRALWRNVYQGVGTVLLVTVPSSGVFFTAYEGLKHVLGDSATSDGGRGRLPLPLVHGLSSCGAQLVNCAVLTPAEVLKQNAQVLATATGEAKNKGSSPSATLTVLRQLRRHPTRLWRGYTALAARDLPFTALQFPAFEYMKSLIIAKRLKASEGRATRVSEQSWIAGFSAGVTGSAAAWITTPFDVIKTRMMLGAGGTSDVRRMGNERIRVGKGRGGSRKSGFAVGKEVLQKEGLRGLFRGGVIRAALTALGNGLYMGCYEGAKLYLVKDGE